MEYDAIVAGVNPGGLNNMQQIRLLVCYILRSVKSPVGKEMLPELLQYEGLANFFEVTQSIDDLLKAENIEPYGENGEMIKLTPKGDNAIKELEFILPPAVKEKAVRAAVSLMTKIRIAKENKVNITPAPNGLNVECVVMDRDMELLKVTLWVPDKAQAEAVRRSFMDDPMRVYSGSIALLLGIELKKEGNESEEQE